MNRSLLAPLLVSALVLPALAAAQSSAGTAAKPGTKPQVKRMADKPARQAAPAPVPAEIDLPPAEGAQTAAASMTFFGDYQCEFDQKLVVAMNPKHDAYIDVNFRNRVYTMKPVLSHTGAVRLEDVRGQMLVVQIATKSMMIDTKAGQRVVDGCTHEKQRDFAANMPKGEGIGIEPGRPLPAAVTPATPPAAVVTQAVATVGAALQAADAATASAAPTAPAAAPAAAATPAR